MNLQPTIDFIDKQSEAPRASKKTLRKFRRKLEALDISSICQIYFEMLVFHNVSCVEMQRIKQAFPGDWKIRRQPTDVSKLEYTLTLPPYAVVCVYVEPPPADQPL